jgi:hypothetical protein
MNARRFAALGVVAAALVGHSRRAAPRFVHPGTKLGCPLVARDRPRLLARQAGKRHPQQYTSSTAAALSHEPEAIPEEEQAKISDEARRKWQVIKGEELARKPDALSARPGAPRRAAGPDQARRYLPARRRDRPRDRGRRAARRRRIVITKLPQMCPDKTEAPRLANAEPPGQGEGRSPCCPTTLAPEV